MDDRCSAGGRQVVEAHAPWEGAQRRSTRPRRSLASTRRQLVTGGLVTGLTGAVFALACSTSAPAPASSGGVSLTIGIPQSKQDDPTHSIATLASAISNQRLTASDAAGHTTPLLLERWEVAPDGLTWTLTLRPNVSFHDGSPVTSADVKRTLNQIRDSSERSAQTACFADVRSIDIAGDLNVIVRLSRRCSMLLDDIDYSVTKSSGSNTEVGTGPFVPATSAPDAMTLTANSRYFLGKPAIDRVEIRAYDTLREAWAEMLRGQVDFLWEVSPDAAEFLRDQDEIELRSHLSYFVYTVVLNSARPPFGRTEVRQALNLAIDRQALLARALRGQGVAAVSPIWPNHWARPDDLPLLAYDPKQAVARLRQVMGVSPGARLGNQAPILTFTCLLPEGFTIYERLALLVQQQLRAIDVDMRLEALPANVFNRRIGAGDFDAVLIPVLGGPNISLHYRLWHSPSPSARWNFWRYQSADVDAALDTLRDALNDDDVRRAVAALDGALRTDPPGLVLVWSQALQAVSRRFAVPDSGSGRDGLHVLWAWKPSGAGAPAP